MKALLLILGLIAPNLGYADTWIVGTLYGHHYGTDKSYEQRTFGLGIEQTLTKTVRFAGGVYRNSNRRDSLYAGVGWFPMEWGRLKLGTAALLVGGYETQRDPELVKAVFPVVSWEGRQWGVNLALIPKVKDDQPGVIGLQVKYAWR